MTIKRNPGNNKKREFKPESSDSNKWISYRNLHYIGLSAGLVISLTAGFFIQSSNEKLAEISARLAAANLGNEQLLVDLTLNKQQFAQFKKQMIQAQQEELEFAQQIQSLASDFEQVQDDQASIRSQLLHRNAQIQKQSKQLIQLQNQVQRLTDLYRFGLQAIGVQFAETSKQVQVTNLKDLIAKDNDIRQYYSARVNAVPGLIDDARHLTILSDVTLLKHYLIGNENDPGRLSDISFDANNSELSSMGNTTLRGSCDINMLSNGWLQIPQNQFMPKDKPQTCLNNLIANLSPHHLLIQLDTNREFDLYNWQAHYPMATILIDADEPSKEQNKLTYSAYLIPEM